MRPGVWECPLPPHAAPADFPARAFAAPVVAVPAVLVVSRPHACPVLTVSGCVPLYLFVGRNPCILAMQYRCALNGASLSSGACYWMDVGWYFPATSPPPAIRPSATPAAMMCPSWSAWAYTASRTPAFLYPPLAATVAIGTP